jgi:serine/threonine protein kinase
MAMTGGLTPGAKFADYVVGSRLGEGGMAVVYRAWDPNLEREVALKILNRSLASDERFQRRFVRESKMAASLAHPNVVPIFATGRAKGLLYLAMQLVEGTDLQELLRREEQLDGARTLSIMGQVARALDAAHRRGLIHRDVKPANILIVPRAHEKDLDEVYLSDFGLTKRRDSETRLTATGQFLGTLDYVSPEQIQGGAIDGRADVYALGCVMYECLIGKPPFQKDTEVALIYAHLQDPPPMCTHTRSDLPAAIDSVVATAMAKLPDDRYSTAGELIAAARASLEADAQPSIPTRPYVSTPEVARVSGPAFSYGELVFPISRTRNILGRHDDPLADRPDIDLTALDVRHRVSRKHAMVTVSGRNTNIHDVGSRNGTYVNGERLQPGIERPLRDTDEIGLGRHLRLKYWAELEWPPDARPEGGRITGRSA